MAKFVDDAGAKVLAGEIKKRYTKPTAGIPEQDLDASVKSTLSKANSALQTESDPTVPAWAKTPNKPSYTAAEIQNLLGITGLENYYSKTEVDSKVSAIPKFAIEVVTTLPSSGQKTATIYLLKSGSESDNLYTEYIYVNSKWEILGRQRLDMSGYALKTELPTAMTEAEVLALFS